MIFVLAGTTEARQTISLLRQEGFQVGASVVSAYGSHLLLEDGAVDVSQGRFQQSDLVQALLDRQVSILVDATHPYAIEISKLAMAVARDLHIPYIRLERQGSVLPEHPLVIKIESLDQLREHMHQGQKVFSTLGSKNLPLLVPMAEQAGAELTVRVLPCVEAMQICEQLGIQPEHIVAIKGPVTADMNRACYRQYQAELVITKESGGIGGIDQKITVALEMGIPIVVMTRPTIAYPISVATPEEVLLEIRRMQ